MAHMLHGPKTKSTLSGTTLGEIFFNHSRKYSDHICQIDGETGDSETFASLCRRSTRLALHLQKRGVTTDDVLISCSRNTLDNIVPVIAASFLGARIANIDPTLSERQITHLVKLAVPTVLFLQENSRALVEHSLKNAVLAPEIIVFEAFFPNLHTVVPGEDDFRPVKINVHKDLFLFFSSGTTGLPKAICHSSYSFLQGIENIRHLNLISSPFLHFNTFYWIAAHIFSVLCFIQGATRVFSRSTNGQTVLEIIDKYQVASLFTAPILLFNVLDVKEPERYHYGTLKNILIGGTTTSSHQLDKLQAFFESGTIYNIYGTTEFLIATIFCPEAHLTRTKPGSCGKAVCNTTIKVVDAGSSQTLGPGQKGEIYVKTESHTTGYYKMNSTRCFDDDGFVKTGDIGYYDEDGCVYILGRTKEMFKFRSWHVVPLAIETVLLDHPDVKECMVYGVPAGDEGHLPAALVVPRNAVSTEVLMKFVAAQVSDIERLRGGIKLVESLPKTATGKIIRAPQ